MLESCGEVPDTSVTISLNQLSRRTGLSCPTVIESLARLEDLGLVVLTTPRAGEDQDLLCVGPAGQPDRLRPGAPSLVPRA